jgi:hypothetical protein
MLKNKVQIYPPKAGLLTQVNIFPITNIFKGSGTILSGNKFFSFIHPNAFNSGTETCAFWYSPANSIVLQNITFQYEVVTALTGVPVLQIFVNDHNIAEIALITTVGVQNISLNNMSTYLNNGDSVYMVMKVNSGEGTYKVFSTTAIFTSA